MPKPSMCRQFCTIIEILLGLSPSGFTTHETKVHMVCESELDKLKLVYVRGYDSEGVLGLREVMTNDSE
jgi:hypothetical protein